MPSTTTKGRVVISRNPEAALKLADSVFTKHVADGATSELKNLDSMFNWDVTGPTIATCLAFHNQAEALKSQMEETYRKRDTLLVVIDDLVRGSSTYLKGKYSKNPKKLGEWGYPVDDTPKAKKKIA